METLPDDLNYDSSNNDTNGHNAPSADADLQAGIDALFASIGTSTVRHRSSASRRKPVHSSPLDYLRTGTHDHEAGPSNWADPPAEQQQGYVTDEEDSSIDIPNPNSTFKESPVDFISGTHIADATATALPVTDKISLGDTSTPGTSHGPLPDQGTSSNETRRPFGPLHFYKPGVTKDHPTPPPTTHEEEEEVRIFMGVLWNLLF